MGANAEIARRWFEEVWNQKREGAIDALIATSCAGWLADDREVHSPADFKVEWRQLLGAFPDLTIRVDDLIEEGDRVAVRWSVTAIHGGSGLGLPPTFNNVSFRGMTWMEIRGGQIVRGWDSWNLGGLIQQLAAAATSH